MSTEIVLNESTCVGLVWKILNILKYIKLVSLIFLITDKYSQHIVNN